MRWAGHVVRMGRGDTRTVFWWEYLKERDHLEDPDLDGIIILRWNFRKWAGAWTGLSGSGRGHVVGTCERGNELSRSTKCGEFLE